MANGVIKNPYAKQ